MNNTAKDARAVANHLIALARNDDKWFTPLQILKLVYYCQGWTLSLFDGERLFRQEIEAWRYGPVVPDVYHKAKIYVEGPITKSLPVISTRKFSPMEDKLIAAVYHKYGNYSGTQLIKLTHLPESPWHKIWTNRKSDNDVIPVDVIQKYFDAFRKQS